MPPLPTVLQLRSCKETNQDDLSMRFQIRLDEYSLEITIVSVPAKPKLTREEWKEKYRPSPPS
jgi:hypothetical protein